MKMKKMFTGLVLFGATLALVACGKAEDKKSTEEAPATTVETTVEATAATWKDGIYTGKESDFDDKGWKVVHSITIEGGKITASKFDYEDKDGKLKSADEKLNETMKEKTGVSAKEAMEKLNADILTSQSADAEVVSGATSASSKFVESTKALLAAAEKGDTKEVTFTFSK